MRFQRNTTIVLLYSEWRVWAKFKVAIEYIVTHRANYEFIYWIRAGDLCWFAARV
jgi:hypothetical protein